MVVLIFVLLGHHNGMESVQVGELRVMAMAMKRGSSLQPVHGMLAHLIVGVYVCVGVPSN